MRNRATLSTIFLVAVLVRESPAMPPQRGDQLLLSASGPFHLSADPVEIPLRGNVSLPARVAALAPGERIYLVLRDLSANEQPGVVYHVYLGGASEAKNAEAKKEDQGRLLGTLNFFNAVPLKDAKPGARTGSTRSIDVTEVFKKLRATNSFREPITVTLQPSGTPVATAKPAIGRVELVVSR